MSKRNDTKEHCIDAQIWKQSKFLVSGQDKLVSVNGPALVPLKENFQQSGNGRNDHNGTENISY